MANYKNIVDVESVAEATESMNVLVEDAGSLKKVPAGGMLGGGNGNFCFIDGEEKAAELPMSSGAFPDFDMTASMSYNELLELINSGELAGIIGRLNMSDGYSRIYFFVHYTFVNIDANEIEMAFIVDGNYVTIYFHSDGRINYSSDASIG